MHDPCTKRSYNGPLCEVLWLSQLVTCTIESRERKHTSAQRTHPSSHTPYRSLSTSEKITRMHRLHSLQRNTHKQLERLKAKLAAAVERNGSPVDEQMHRDLTTIVAAQSPYIESTYPPDSFQRLFWEQQKQANSCKDARSMRWHPLMIKWCVYLRHLSSSAYETLRDSGCITLPSQRTLRDYTHYVPAIIGFSAAGDHWCSLVEARQRRRHALSTCLTSFLIVLMSVVSMLA